MSSRQKFQPDVWSDSRFEKHPVVRLSSKPTEREYANTILDNISDAIFLLDNTGLIKEVNRTALSLLKARKNQLKNIFIDEIIVDTPNHLKYADRPGIMEAMHQGVFQDVEALLVYQETMIPVYVSFSLVHNNDGSVNSIIVSARDISHIKHLEKKLLEQQILTISQDRLRSLGEMLVGLVHDLGQPLSSLNLVAGMIKDTLDSAEPDTDLLKKYNVDIFSFITRMSATVHSIRSFAQRTQDETASLIDIEQSIREALSLIRYDLTQRSIEIDLHFAKNIPKIYINPVSLDQVFVNLLSNAKDAFDAVESNPATDRNSAKIIRINVAVSARNEIEITIADNAGGISDDTVDKIFDPFFTTREPGKNTGLGLSIAQSILKNSGGSISLKKYSSTGSQFLIKLPFLKSNT